MQLKLLEPRFSVCKLQTGEKIPYEDEFVFTGKTDARKTRRQINFWSGKTAGGDFGLKEFWISL